MSFDVEEIARSETLSDALRSVLKLRERGVGTLIIASGAVKGSLTIVDGYIVGARIHSADVGCEEALRRLINLPQAVFCFNPEKMLSSQPQCSILVRELLASGMKVPQSPNRPESPEDKKAACLEKARIAAAM